MSSWVIAACDMIAEGDCVGETDVSREKLSKSLTFPTCAREQLRVVNESGFG